LRQLVTVFESPRMQAMANDFTDWLTRKVGGPLPSPRVRLIGASEQLWPAIYETHSRTQPCQSLGGRTFRDWQEGVDACAFSFLAEGSDGRLRGLTPDEKAITLPWLFPYYEEAFLKTLMQFDAVVFLRLSKLPDPKRQVIVMGNECVRVVQMWLGRERVASDPRTGQEDPRVISWLAEYAKETQQV